VKKRERAGRRSRVDCKTGFRKGIPHAYVILKGLRHGGRGRAGEK